MRKKRPSVGSLSMQNYPNKSAGTVFINPAPPVPAPPVNIEAPLLSGTGAVESTVTCSSGVWTGSPTPTYTYIFYVDGIEEQNSSSNEFFVHETYDGLTITAEVTATNTEGSATEPASNSIVVGTIPVNTVEPTLSPSGIQSTGTLITINERTWDGTPPLTFEYRWLRDGIVIDGEDGKTYTIAIEDDGTVITAEVKASNAYGESAYIGTSNQVDAVNAIAPVNTARPVVSGTYVVGQTLSTTNGTWTGIPTPTYSYQWYRGATLISGATSSTYTLASADAGNTSNIKCTVTATNSAGSASADSNTVAQILTVRTNSFLTASGISDATIRGGLNTFDIGLISNSLDTKMRAVYPFVGGTASTHRWNFMDSRDLDAAFRLVFSGGWTHSSNGGQPNGTNGYADTFIVPSSVQNVNSNGLGIYVTSYTVSGADPIQIGAINGSTQRTFIAATPTTLSTAANATLDVSSISGNSGFFSVQKTSSTITSSFRNGTLINSYNSGGSLPTLKIFLGTSSLTGNAAYGAGYNNSQFRFAYISTGLNSTEISTLYNLVQTFQTTLGRNV